MAKKERRRQQLDASLRFLLFAVFSSALFTRASSLRSRRRRLAEGGGKSARALEKGAPQRRSSFEKECEKTSELFPSFRVFFLSLSLSRFFFQNQKTSSTQRENVIALGAQLPASTIRCIALNFVQVGAGHRHLITLARALQKASRKTVKSSKEKVPSFFQFLAILFL
jgi:hypothetical protein